MHGLSRKSQKSKLPAVVPLLALGTFLMCTTEFMIAGLLPQMSDDFGVRPSQIGLLITAFAIGMIVGAPAMAIATLRVPKRLTLVLALAIFAAGHVIAALSGSFALLVAARVLTAVVTGAFWSVASVVATRRGRSSRKLTRARRHGQWRRALHRAGRAARLACRRAPRLARNVLGRCCPGGVAAVVIGRFAPADQPGPPPSARAELRALRSGRLWLVLTATVLVMGGCMGTFSFLSPLLTERAGISLRGCRWSSSSSASGR